MNYLVSAENTPYHHWQLQLLIHSFYLHNLHNNLFIALAETDLPVTLDHKNIFTHKNIGRIRNYPPLNRPTALALALDLVPTPITLIDPDMLLVHPVPPPTENISFSLNPTLTPQFAQQYLPNIPTTPWIPLGNVMTFNHFPHDLPLKTIQYIEKLEFERKLASNQNWWYTEKIAWILNLLDHNLPYSHHNYEMSLLDNQSANFIHYNHGLPPYFNKRMYQYTPPLQLALGNPLHTLLQYNPTPSTNYTQIVVKSYLDSSKKN